jgi:metallo-beta-lactamase class B
MLRASLVVSAYLFLAAGVASCGHASASGPVVPGGFVRLASDLTVRQLTRHVFVVTHEEPVPANSVVVETVDGTLVVVGSPYTPSATRVLLDWLAEKFGERRRVAINTHFHADAGIGGNAVFQEMKIPIYGSDLTVQLLAERQPGAVPPDHVFPLRAGVDLEFGEGVRVVYPGPGHTRDNVVVHFPRHRLLVGGCLLKAGDQLGNIADADLANWDSSVRALERYQVEWLVPGHGDRVDPGLIANTLAVLRAARGD